MKPDIQISRRGFLKVIGAAGAGLVIQVFLPGCSPKPVPTTEPTVSPTSVSTSQPMATLTPVPTSEATQSGPAWLKPSLYLKIGNDGIVTVTVYRSEMGQGVRTAMPMVVAEELGADWSTVKVEQALADGAYGDQMTGGSVSTQSSYKLLRQAGAVAREMLLAAAAATWGVEKDACTAENGVVTHQPSGKQLPFKDLVSKAITMPAPSPYSVPLKDPKDFRIIGSRQGRPDTPAIITGSAVYGLDVKTPGMLYATVARCPVIGGTVASFDDAKAKSVLGVLQIVEIDSGVAVVAKDTWAAINGREAMAITWDKGSNNTLNSADLERDLISQATGDANPKQGELAAVYIVPYLAHATLEPMNCVADVRSDRCEIWAPTQNSMAVKQRAISLTGLPAESVRVNVPLIGGGFGRRLEVTLAGSLPVGTDYASEAVQISKAAGAPVHLVWTRDDDFQHDIYHPLTVIRTTVQLNNLNTLNLRRYEAFSGIPTGNWRAVFNVADAFAHESFVDEIAAATKADPLELRKKIVPQRAIPVLELAASKAGWGKPLPPGHSQGLAYHATWNVTHVAQVAEVSVGNDGRVQVHRVVCAIDCGTVVNPDIAVITHK
jgi:isoquinoline 1-oxidoreductase beta subunit